MKTALFLLSLISSFAFASNIPSELLDLAGGSGRTKTYKGHDSDGLQCKVEASDSSLGFATYLTVVDASNRAVLDKIGKLVIGSGQSLDSFKKTKVGFIAIMAIDDRETLEVELRKDGTPAGFKLKLETANAFGGWDEKSKGDCLL
jgi:hypothetical protein